MSDDLDDARRQWGQGAAFERVPRSGQKPLPRPSREFVIRVSFKMKTEGFTEAMRKLEAVSSAQAVLVKAVERAVVRSIVVNIQRRFVANMSKALEMKVLVENGNEVNPQIKERYRDVKLRNRLAKSMRLLNEAQLDGRYEAAERIRKSVVGIGEQLRQSLGKDKKGKRTYKSHKFSQMAGNRFRRQLIALLGLLTDASLVQARAVEGMITVGVGPLQLLERLETPSATMALTGFPTQSRFRTFWRHVEFGTGARRSTAKDRVNRPVNPPDNWWYGTRPGRNMLLAGTAPMNFLTNARGELYASDTMLLARELTKELDALLKA